MVNSSITNPIQSSLCGLGRFGNFGIPSRDSVLMLIQNVSGELVDTIGESITTFVSGSAADIMAAEINFSGATVDTLNTLSGGNLFSVGGVPITRTGQEWYEILLPNPYVYFGINGMVGYSVDKSADAVKINKYLSISNNYSTFISDFFTPPHELISGIYYNVSTTHNYSLRYGIGNARYVNVLFTSAGDPVVGFAALKMQKINIDRAFTGLNSASTPAMTKQGFGSEFTNVLNYYGGKFTYSTNAGDYVQGVFADSDTVGMVAVGSGTNLGMALVSIDDDKTLATSLPTAQDLVTAGTLEASALIANGGTLNPTDRIFDMYGKMNNLPRAGNKTNAFYYQEFATGLTKGTHTVRVTVTPYKRAASSANQAAVYCLTGGSNDYKINASTINVYLPESNVSNTGSRPVWDLSYNAIPTGASVAEWMGHDGSEKISAVPKMWIDDVESSPINGIEYFGAVSVSMKMTNDLRHSQIGAGATNIGTITYEYKLAPITGLTISHTMQWLTTGTTTGYPGMMDLDAIFDKYNTVGNAAQAGQSGDFLDSSGNIAWAWDTDGKTACMMHIPDMKKTVNNWVESFGLNLFWHEISPTWRKLYAGKYMGLPNHSFANEETIESEVNFRFGYYPGGANANFATLVL
jgi:hypothetical protein